MPLFSRRNNLVPQPPPPEPGAISDRLRRLLWNDFSKACEAGVWRDPLGARRPTHALSVFLKYLWSEYWALAADDYPGLEGMLARLKLAFLNEVWFRPFDILEITLAGETYVGFDRTSFRNSITRHLDQETSAYMLLGNKFVLRMGENEAGSVATALNLDDAAVHTHFREALKKLSDRQNPDYRNSVKESISAVESACKKLTGDQSGDLNRALRKLDVRKLFHPAFKQAARGCEERLGGSARS